MPFPRRLCRNIAAAGIYRSSEIANHFASRKFFIFADDLVSEMKMECLYLRDLGADLADLTSH
jgi:hypothetical protein